MSSGMHDLALFVLQAKRRTYAGLDDDATIAAPLLSGSKQLEHRAAPYTYRDIYFGMGFFVGHETVSKDDRVIWSMCYSGGSLPGIQDRETQLSIYKFLRQALLAADVSMPYRGPASFSLGDLTYRNTVSGTLARFDGSEQILRRDTTLFELRYSGGILR